MQKAHRAGLRVAAHIENAADFHNALLGGVDIILGFKRKVHPKAIYSQRAFEESARGPRLATRVVRVTDLKIMRFLWDKTFLNARDQGHD